MKLKDGDGVCPGIGVCPGRNPGGADNKRALFIGIPTAMPVVSGAGKLVKVASHNKQ